MAAGLASLSSSCSLLPLAPLFYSCGKERECLVAGRRSGESGVGMERAVWVDGEV